MQNYFVRLVLTLALCLLLMSCAAPKQKMPIPSTTTSPAVTPSPTASSAPMAASLPPTAKIDLTKQPFLDVLFRTQLKINRIDDLYATTRREVSNLSVVSNCNLDVLRAFVATGWAPIVLVVSSVGGQHLSAVAGYDNTAKQIQLETPVSRTTRSLTYADFQKEWDTGSAGKCVLVTPVKLSEEKVRSTLEKYLPATQISVTVRSR